MTDCGGAARPSKFAIGLSRTNSFAHRGPTMSTEGWSLAAMADLHYRMANSSSPNSAGTPGVDALDFESDGFPGKF